jgi:hypothetical protein
MGRIARAILSTLCVLPFYSASFAAIVSQPLE